MRCPNCGAEIDAKEPFCGNCGSKLYKLQQKKKPRGWILIVIILAILVEACLLYIHFFRDSEKGKNSDLPQPNVEEVVSNMQQVILPLVATVGIENNEYHITDMSADDFWRLVDCYCQYLYQTDSDIETIESDGHTILVISEKHIRDLAASLNLSYAGELPNFPEDLRYTKTQSGYGFALSNFEQEIEESDEAKSNDDNTIDATYRVYSTEGGGEEDLESLGDFFVHLIPNDDSIYKYSVDYIKSIETFDRDDNDSQIAEESVKEAVYYIGKTVHDIKNSFGVQYDVYEIEGGVLLYFKEREIGFGISGNEITDNSVITVVEAYGGNYPIYKKMNWLMNYPQIQKEAASISITVPEPVYEQDMITDLYQYTTEFETTGREYTISCVWLENPKDHSMYFIFAKAK